MTKEFPIWIVVADAAQARLLTVAGPEQPLLEHRVLSHPQGRAHEHELTTDRPGRVMQSHGGPHPGHGSHAAMEPRTTATEVEHERFARHVAQELQHALGQRAFARLVLVASPHFLGLLRHELSPQVQQHVSATLDKDYTHLKVHELEPHLKQHLI